MTELPSHATIIQVKLTELWIAIELWHFQFHLELKEPTNKNAL